jgi:hypothetical protein
VTWDWPPELEATLIRLFNNGVRVKVIAHRLDRPHYAVSRHLWRLQRDGRCSRRKRAWSPADDRVLEAALSMGVGYDDLAAAFGCSRDAIKIQSSKLRRRLLAIAANDGSPIGEEFDWRRDQLSLELTG